MPHQNAWTKVFQKCMNMWKLEYLMWISSMCNMGYEVYESKAFKIIIQHDETQKQQLSICIKKMNKTILKTQAFLTSKHNQ